MGRFYFIRFRSDNSGIEESVIIQLNEDEICDLGKVKSVLYEEKNRRFKCHYLNSMSSTSALSMIDILNLNRL